MRAKQEETSVSGNPTFYLRLEKTYYSRGFFNVIRKFAHHVGDEGPVTLVLSGSGQIAGQIDRKANQNGTPRIMGRAALRNWFQKNYARGDRVPVRFETPRRLILG